MVNNNKSNKPSVAHTLYSGTAAYGKLNAMISAIIGTIIGLIGIVVGIIFLSTTGGYTKISAKVLSDSICVPSPTTNKDDADKQSCNTKISYLNQQKKYH